MWRVNGNNISLGFVTFYDPEFACKFFFSGDRLMLMENRLDEENLLRENPSVDPRSPIANISTGLSHQQSVVNLLRPVPGTCVSIGNLI